MVDGRVMSDLVDPGGELELRAIPAQRVVNLDEDLLGQVQSRFVIPYHAINVAGDGSLVTAHEFFETAIETVDGNRYQFAVGRRAQISCKNWGNGGGRSFHNNGVLRSD